MASSVVGLDIGRTAVRAVELRRGRTVRRFGSVPLAPGSVETGVVSDPRAVTAALRELWKKEHFSTRVVRLGVCSGSVLVRQVELDWMPPADLRKALRYQVADLLPVAVEDANLDHVLLGEAQRTDPETGRSRRVARLLLVATARGAVDETVRAVRAAGLRPVTADLSPLALVRAAGAAHRREGSTGQGAEAVIDLGADKVAVAVHTDGVPHFVRVVPGIGGDLVTQLLTESTGLDWGSAERAKHARPAAPAGDGSADPHRQAVQEALSRLVEEVRTTLDFHSATDPDHVARRAVVVGAGSVDALLREEVGRQLGLPVTALGLDSVLGTAGVAKAGRKGAVPGPELVTSASLCLGAIA